MTDYNRLSGDGVDTPFLSVPRKSRNAASSSTMSLNDDGGLEVDTPKHPCYKTKRCKWCCAITVFLTLVIALVLGLESQHIAASAVDDAIIKIDKLSLLDTSDPLHIQLDIEGSVENDKPLGGTLLSMVVTVDINGQTLGKITLPDQDVGAMSTSPLSVRTTLNLDNAEEKVFDSFVMQTLTQKTITMSMHGTASIKSFGVTFRNIDFSKTFVLNGMDNLAGMEVTKLDIGINGNTTTGEIPIAATINMPNPSPFEVVLGNTSLLSLYKGKYLGPLFCQNCKIMAGSNSLSMSGAIQPHNINDILNFTNRYLQGNTSVLTTEFDANSTSQPTLNRILANYTLDAMVPGYSGQLIKSMEFEALNMDLSQADRAIPVNGQGTIILNSPLGTSPFRVKSLGNIEAHILNELGQVVGKMTAANTILSSEGLRLKVALKGDLDPAGDGKLLGEWLAQFMQSKTVGMHLQGTASAVVSTVIGDMPISLIKIDTTIPLVGLDGMKGVIVKDFDLTHSTQTAIVADLTVVIPNPSIASVSMGNTKFDLFYQDSYLGWSIATSAALQPGNCTLSMSGNVVPADLTKAALLMSLYLSGKSASVVAKANANATTNPVLNQALQSLNLQTVLPGKSDPLVQAINFNSMNMIPLPDPVSVRMESQADITIDSVLGPNGYLEIMTVDMTVNILRKMRDGSSPVLLGSFVVPPTNVTSGQVPKISVNCNGLLSLVDQGAPFTAFIIDYLNSTSEDIIVQGQSNVVSKTAVGTMRLTGVPLNNTVSMIALKDLLLKVNSFDLPSNTPDNKAILINIDTDISNPSVTSFVLGDIKTKMLFQGKQVGVVTLKNFTLQPGTTHIMCTGGIHAAPEDTGALSQFFEMYINGQDAPVEVHGDASADTSKPPWLRSTINALVMSTVVPGGKGINIVPVMSIPYLDMTIGTGDKFNMKGPLNAMVDIPFNFPSTILKATSNVSVSSATAPGIGPIGTIDLPWTPVLHGDTKNITLNINAPLIVSNIPNMEQYLVNTLLDTSVSMRMQGTMGSTLDTAAGVLTVRGISFDDTITMLGFDGVKQLQVDRIDVTGGDPSVLTCAVHMHLYNPSNTTCTAPHVTWDMSYQGKYFGKTVSPDPLHIGQGSNQYAMSGAFDKTNPRYSVEGARDVLSNYINNITSELSIVGTAASMDNPLQYAMSQVPLTTFLPGINVRMISGSELKNIDISIFPPSISIATEIDFVNPLDVPIHIFKMDLKLNFHARDGSVQPLGLIQVGSDDGPSLADVPPKSSFSMLDPVTHLHSMVATTCLIAQNKLVVDTAGPIVIGIQEFKVTVDFAQTGIKVGCEFGSVLKSLCDGGFMQTVLKALCPTGGPIV